MILVANRIHIAPAHAEAFEHLFATRARRVDHMPGFIANQVLKATTARHPCVTQTLWQSRADFIAWTRSDECTTGHVRTESLPEAFTAPTTLELYDVYQQTQWPAPSSTNGTATES